MTLDDFQKSLQEAANCPLRPFVVPFLLAYLPVLQKEVAHLARSSKQVRVLHFYPEFNWNYFLFLAQPNDFYSL